MNNKTEEINDFEEGMSQNTIKFETRWLKKLSNCLESSLDTKTAKKFLENSENLPEKANHSDVILWTKQLLKKLEQLNYSKRKAILTGCACLYPKNRLESIRKHYKKTEDLYSTHKLLQDRYIQDTMQYLKLDEKQMKDILQRGWGVAGIIQNENIIIATKMPKDYYNYIEAEKEQDEVAMRYYFCHCPRVRHILLNKQELTKDYCYCGAGFYKDIWEFILQKPVSVEVLQSVLEGKDSCKIKIDVSHG